ncbi:regulator of G-protein signaling 5 isoform X2 [Stigmatopora nigra]
MATLRRFSSEGNLLDLDFFCWRKVDINHDNHQESGIYTNHVAADGEISNIQKPRQDGNTLLTKEHSISAENLRHLEKKNKRHLEQRHHHRAKLAAAKLHLKNLFGHSPNASNSNLSNTEQKDSAKERRSRLLFMHQWSPVGHSNKHKINKEELEKWAEDLDYLLASQTGLSVFAAFLRSEFSEENLQFYLACEQYRQSSNNFSLQRRAKDICTTYIQPNSPREVNLDSKTRDLTIQLLQDPSDTSLSLAQKRIYSLLDTDCYPRFIQSEIYLSLLREVD